MSWTMNLFKYVTTDYWWSAATWTILLNKIKSEFTSNRLSFKSIFFFRFLIFVTFETYSWPKGTKRFLVPRHHGTVHALNRVIKISNTRHKNVRRHHYFITNIQFKLTSVHCQQRSDCEKELLKNYFIKIMNEKLNEE